MGAAELLVPVRRLGPQPVPRFGEEPAGHPYGRVALQEELAAVAHAPKGRRNHTLYQAGIRLYSLVAGGVLDRAEVQAGLLAAADAARLLPRSHCRPTAPWRRPSALGSPIHAASPPATSRYAPLRRVLRGRS